MGESVEIGLCTHWMDRQWIRCLRTNEIIVDLRLKKLKVICCWKRSFHISAILGKKLFSAEQKKSTFSLRQNIYIIQISQLLKTAYFSNHLSKIPQNYIAQLAGAVEYTDYTSAEG